MLIAEIVRFEQFGSQHLAAMLAIAAFTALFAVILRRADRQPGGSGVRRAVCWPLAGFLVAATVGEQIYEIATGLWSLEESLPLHLCDLAIFVTAAALYIAGRSTPREPAGAGQITYELAYFWGLGGTLQAVLTPDLVFACPHPIYFTYFANHGGIVAGVMLLTIGLRLRPRPGALLRVWVATNLLGVLVALFNWVAGANYMFLCGPPRNPSLFDYFGPWPWSLFTLEVVGTGILALCYAPFWVLGRLGATQRK